MVNIAFIFQNIGGGAVWPPEPLLHEVKKNSSRIIPCISGENSCITYPPHRGFHDKKCENSRKYQHQSARNGLRMHHLHPFFQRRNQPGKTPPLFFCKRRKFSIYIKRWKIILLHHIYPRCRSKIGENFNKQSTKRAHKAQFASVFQKKFLGETLTPPPLLREDKNLPSWALYGVKTHLAIGQKWAQNALFASIFQKKIPGETLDPLLQEGDIHSRIYIAKGKNSPASCISELWRQKLHKNLGAKSTRNRQKMDSECTICINFSKKFPGGGPRTPACRRGYPLPHLYS